MQSIILLTRALTSSASGMESTLGMLSSYAADSSPGRFFAINEVKLMLAFVLLKYDVKTKDGIRPPGFCFLGQAVPHMTAEILFRKKV